MKRKRSLNSNNASTTFHNAGAVQNQAGTQTVHGSIYNGPVYYHAAPDRANYTSLGGGTSSTLVPPLGSDRQRSAPQSSTDEPDSQSSKRERCLRSLHFDAIESRHATIRSAHVRTCRWLLKRREYEYWLSQDALRHHRGFLWIKGKPGAGKSTIMKYALSNFRKLNPGAIVTAFFFNARGESLERSVEGMYRSILFQLLEQAPDLQLILDSPYLALQKYKTIKWTDEILRSLLVDAVGGLGNRSLVCFVDALDECDEAQVRDMVSFFEQLGLVAAEAEVSLRTCFSSRHYPNLSIENCISMILEEQQGHREDLIRYLESELRIGKNYKSERIRQDIFKKASGIFLWVVLVVRMLNEEYAHGDMDALSKRLEEIPNDLEALFDDVLNRDGQPGQRMMLCLQWVLFARKPLKPEELYFAIKNGLDMTCVEYQGKDRMSASDISRYIVHSSKGLVEETKHGTVQFIHESIRDFFLRGTGLKRGYFGSVDTFASRSHDQLKLICHNFYQCTDILACISRFRNISAGLYPEHVEFEGKVLEALPFLEYAVNNILYHSDKANKLGNPQETFIKGFDFQFWLTFHHFLRPYHVESYRGEISLTDVLIDQGLASLITLNSQCFRDWFRPRRFHGSPLTLALNAGNEDVVQALFKAAQTEMRSMTNDQEEDPSLEKETRGAIGSILAQKYQSHIRYGADPAEIAVLTGDTALMKMLIDSGWLRLELYGSGFPNALLPSATAEEKAEFRSTVEHGGLCMHDIHTISNRLLSQAISKNHAEMIRTLLAYRDFKCDYLGWQNSLAYAVEHGEIELVADLLEHHLAPARGFFEIYCSVSLLRAAHKGCIHVVELLLAQRGINANQTDSDQRTPLIFAARAGHVDVARLLLVQPGILVNHADFCQMTPLLYATVGGHIGMVRILLSHSDISVNQGDRFHMTPLLYAAKEGRTEIVNSLLAWPGINVNQRDCHQKTALFYAAKMGRVHITKALLAHQDIDVSRKELLQIELLLRAKT